MPGVQPRPEVLAFLHHIKEHPKEDAPRLILADWLEEHGDDHDVARAHLIRAQVEAANLPPYHPRRVELEGSVRRLCRSHQVAWLGPLAGAVRRAWFERGLLHVEASTGRFVSQRTAALVGSEAYAWLEHVRFPALARPGLDQLASLPLLESVTELEVRPDWRLYRSPAALAGLFQCEYLARLLTLRLIAVDNPDEVLVQLANSPLTRLRALGLTMGRLGVAAVTALARSPRFGQLTALELSSCLVTSEHVRELADSPVLRQVASLSLPNNALDNAGLAQLVGSPLCRSLTSLNLAGCRNLTGAGLAPLAGSPHLGGLQILDLSRIHVGQEGARLLAGSSHLPRLTALRVAGVSYLRDWQPLDDAAVATLSRSPRLAPLTALDLSHNRLGTPAALALASSSTLTRLTALNLAGNQIGYEGAIALARSPILANIFFLDLSSNLIRRTGARALAESPYLPPGATLRLASNRLNVADRAMLRERFGERVKLSGSLQEQRV